MNELTRIYKNQPVRIMERNGETWFVAKDVATILGYDHAPHMTRRLDKDEKDVLLTDSPSGKQKTTVINEYGLFAAILKSNKKEAIDFQRWITHEVLPSIRKTGSYSIPGQQPWYRLKPRFTWNDLPALTEEKRKLDRFADERDYVQAAINRVRYEEATKRLSPHDVERELFPHGAGTPVCNSERRTARTTPRTPGIIPPQQKKQYGLQNHHQQNRRQCNLLFRTRIQIVVDARRIQTSSTHLCLPQSVRDVHCKIKKLD